MTLHRKKTSIYKCCPRNPCSSGVLILFSIVYVFHTGRQPTSFPGHQPEFDLSAGRAAYNDWNTTSTASYRPYSDQKLPLPTVLKVILFSIPQCQFD